MRALFGMNLTDTVTVTVTGSPTSSGATMDYASREDGAPAVWNQVAASDDAWTFELGAGSYAFRLTDASASGTATISVSGDVTIVTIPDEKDVEEPTTVIYGPLTSTETAVCGDPKDPWPPPPPPPPPFLSQSALDWFNAVLLIYAPGGTNENDAPRGDEMPDRPGFYAASK